MEQNTQRRKYKIRYNKIEYPKDFVNAVRDKLSAINYGEGYLNCPHQIPDKSLNALLPVSGKTILCIFDKSGHMITARSIVKLMLWSGVKDCYVVLEKKLNDFKLLEYRDYQVKSKKKGLVDTTTKNSFVYDSIAFDKDFKTNLTKKLKSINFDPKYLKKPNHPKVRGAKHSLPESVAANSIAKVFTSKGRMITSALILDLMVWSNSLSCEVKLHKKMVGGATLTETRTYLLEKVVK